MLGSAAEQLPTVNTSVIKEGRCLDRQQLKINASVISEEILVVLEEIDELKALGVMDIML